MRQTLKIRHFCYTIAAQGLCAALILGLTTPGYSKPSEPANATKTAGFVDRATTAERPLIQANKEDKARVLALVEKYDWAADLFSGMKEDIAPLIKAHKEDPAKSLQNAPAFGKTAVQNHIGWMSQAARAGELYFMTGDEDYAQFAADRLNYYVQFLGIEGQDPIVSSHGRQRDYRDVHDKVALSYDWAQPFLIKAGTTVYDIASQKRIAFDHDKAQLMFSKIVEYGLAHSEGANIAIMIAPSIFMSALCIENQAKRDGYIDKFVKGHGRFGGLLQMKNVLVENNGNWPESVHYSGLGAAVPLYMEILDRLYPEYKIFEGFEDTLIGKLERRLLVYPNETERVNFGDSHRQSGPPQAPQNYARVIRRVGSEKVAYLFFGQMKADRERHGYTPSDLWSMDPLEAVEARSIESQALHLPYAGVIIQNNLHGADQKQDGMMYYTGGAAYVHNQLSGLDLEFYGAGHVMNGVGGNYGPRSAPVFGGYYVLQAGHNTVIVNGESKGAAQGPWPSSLRYMDTTELEAVEPAPLTPAVSKHFSFSSQVLNDTVNNAKQQRIVAIVRTSDTSGYYFDLFRSRSNAENRFHDYLYRNMGERLALYRNEDAELPLAPADDRYQSHVTVSARVGSRTATAKHPGWHFFSEVMTSSADAAPIRGTFFMPALKRYTHVAMPGGFDREYTWAQAPAILQAAEPYSSTGNVRQRDKTRAQVLTIRQPGEAWERPFIVIYEPSASEQPTVQSVDNIIDENKVIGAKVVSRVGDALITDWILARDDDDAGFQDPAGHLNFQGRFAIVRTIQRPSGNEISLYLGAGRHLSFFGNRVTPEPGESKGFKNFKMN